MNKAVSWAVVTALTVIFCACTPEGSVGISFDTKEYVMDNIKIKAETPHFSGFADNEFENELNGQYETNTKTWIDEFTQSVQGKKIEDNFMYEFDLSQNVRNNSLDFVSLVSEIYTFTGGAHGATSWIAKNIDAAQNKEITLKELFRDEVDYKKELDRIMLEMVESDKDEYSDLWEMPVISKAQESDFYIQNGNLTIYYHPYDLSYYARGFVEFPIKLKDLLPYLKDEYHRLAE